MLSGFNAQLGIKKLYMAQALADSYIARIFHYTWRNYFPDWQRSRPGYSEVRVVQQVALANERMVQ